MFTQDELVKILSGEGEPEAKAEAIFALHEEDVVGLKANRQEIKTEKENALARLMETEGKLKKSAEEIADLQKKLSEGSSDEMKKYYEDKVSEVEKMFRGQIDERDVKIKNLETKSSSLEKDKLYLECLREFDEAALNKNIDPSGIPFLKDSVLGVDGSKFARKEVATGQMALLSAEGKTIKRTLEEFLITSVGKRFVLNGNSGGGGKGSGSEGGGKTMTRAEFDALPPERKISAIKEFEIIG